MTADERAAAEEQAEPQAAIATASNQPVIALEVTARTPGGGVFVREAVLRLDPSASKGYVVLDWRRGDLSDP